MALVAEPETDELSRAEEALIEEAFAKFENLNRWDLVRVSHEFPEWQDPNGSAIPIQYPEILQAGKKTESEIAAAEAELESLAATGAMLQPAQMDCGDTFLMPAWRAATQRLWRTRRSSSALATILSYAMSRLSSKATR